MKRVITALFLIPLVAWVTLAAPTALFLAVLAITGLLAYHEFDHITAKTGIGAAGWPGTVAGLALLFGPRPIVIAVLIAMLALALSLRVKDFKQALPAAGAFVIGIAYIFGAWRCAAELHAIDHDWLLFAMLLSWAGDTAAYYVGRAIGKHQMAPRVSPAKSWEGAAGSVAGAMLVGAIYAHYLLPRVSLTEVLTLAAAGNIAGQIGDLCESALKRGAGVTDSGNMLPGHGGWLDRLDSSLFSIPMVYALLLAFTRPA